jgi:hypothetical protein
MDDQQRHYQAKLEYEIDPWDLNEALQDRIGAARSIDL